MTDTDESHTSGSDYPAAQDLISTQRKRRSKIPEHAANAQKEHLCSRQKDASAEVDSSDSEIDVSAASGSKHRRKCSAAPSKQKRRLQPSRQQAEADAGVPDSENSDSSLPPQSPVRPSEASQEKKSKLNLKAIFAYHFRGRKFKAAAHRKYRSSGSQKTKKPSECSRRRGRKQPMTASPQERRKRLKDRGFQFSFVEKHYGRKHIPLKMVLSYEQAAAKGYFQYVEMLKYEDHLKKALKALEASEDLERECLTVRKHKYVDDEGPVSPIQETNDDDNCLGSNNPEDLDVRVVDNSCFIISSKIPTKKKSKAETKRAKSAGAVKAENSAAVCCFWMMNIDQLPCEKAHHCIADQRGIPRWQVTRGNERRNAESHVAEVLAHAFGINGKKKKTQMKKLGALGYRTATGCVKWVSCGSGNNLLGRS